MIGIEQAQQIMPRAPGDMLVALLTAMPQWQINTVQRAAVFLAQVAHESLELSALEENLNYSAGALVRTWPKRFSNAEADALEREGRMDEARMIRTEIAGPFAFHPQAIANFVYANRFGNGDMKSGDGWRYRGRGPIQITFHDNYAACGKAIGRPLAATPELLKTPAAGAESACWFWATHGCNEMADAGDFYGVTRAINGGTAGMNHRMAYLGRAEDVLHFEIELKREG